MEAYSSSKAASKSKGVKTYEGKRNKGDWRSYEESDEETILLAPSSRTKKNSKRRATTGPESTPGNDLTLPPLQNDRKSQQGKLNDSISSTIPNTSIKPPPSLDPTTARQSTSSARMTTPTMSARSPHNLSAESTGPEQEEKDHVAEVEQQPSSYAAPETKTIAEVLIDNNITPSSYEARDELALPPSTHGLRSSSPPRNRSKRKLSFSTNTDELGSDDFAIGLPKEHYQPRPSRSRASKTLDDTVLAIDYSKRPEAVARKMKRRKTTGAEVDMKDEGDQEMTDFPAKRTERLKSPPQAVGEDVIALNCEPEEEIRDVAKAIFEGPPLVDEALVPVGEAVPPKKKRGRPKKQVEQDVGETSLTTVDEPNAAPKETAQNSAVAPAKKTRKPRKTTEEVVVVSEEILVEDDELVIAGKSREVVNDHVLEANDNAANVRSGLRLNQDEPLQPVDEDDPTQGPATMSVETPKKQLPKGPNKHSPLNTGKIQYRVGLSKRVRIEPLLKVVRK